MRASRSGPSANHLGHGGVTLNETAVPLHKLLSIALWALTGALLLAGWIVYFADLADLALMLMCTGVLTALGGATATTRTWVMCVVQMVRLTSMDGSADPRIVRRVRE